VPPEGEKLSLREKADYDCVFWKNGCTVYESRPLQCRSFPFWESALLSPGSWKRLSCPGLGKGDLHSKEYIETCLAQQKAEPVLVREAPIYLC
jgi:Fe-S-cluster containining protein